MAYSKEIIEKALKLKQDRLNEAKAENENLYKRLCSSNPRLVEIDSGLSYLGGQLVATALSGDKKKLDLIKQELEALKKEKAHITSEIEPWLKNFDCEKCEDTGYSDGKICECVLHTARKIVYDKLCEEYPLENYTFNNFNLAYYPDAKTDDGFSPKKVMTTTLKMCKEFVSAFPSGKNMLFLGSCGLGKTHLSLAVAGEVINKGYNVIYASTQNLVNAISRENFDRSGSTEKIDSVLECDLLILDDLGTEFSTQLSTSIIYNIVNTRLLKNRSTIISTNLELEEIEKVYDSRIVSRIVGGYQMRKFIGDDIRQIKALKGK